MTECQGCGAWNDSSRTVCVLCGTPLAETDEWDAAAELPPLPPLPDGGLSATMPTWLREPPAPEAGNEVFAAPAPETAPAFVESLALRLAAQTDPRLFLTDDDFPRWLRDLAAAKTAARAAETPSDMPSQPSPWPAWSTPPVAMPAVEAPPPAAATPANDPPVAAAVAARAREERRHRAPWETLLLVILFIGMIVAALWALASNGVFSPGM